MVHWDDLGFVTNYAVDDDIEYPGDGQWGMPIHELATGRILPTPGPVAIIRPTGGEPWVLAAGFIGVAGLYGTPDPSRLCAFERFGRVVLVDIRNPADQVELAVHPVRIAAHVDRGLLLVCDWQSVTAIGAEGIRWKSAELVRDDLHITRARGDRIDYWGNSYSGVGAVRGSLDARTGTAA